MEIKGIIHWAMALGFLVAIAIGAFFSLIVAGKMTIEIMKYVEEKRATAECMKWREQSESHQDFYLTTWGKKQCDTYNITIDAPVK